MSRGKLVAILIVVALLGVGGIVIRTELIGHPDVSNTITVSTPDQAAQQRAEQQSEQQAIDSACAALRKMGGANKNCPPPSK